MADRPLDVYLNDHLGGATLGADLAGQIRDRTEGTPLGEIMARIAAEIEEDREQLSDLMDALDVSRNPVKQVTGWVAEKASRVKFSGAGSGERDQGLLMALESLRLGVAGKKCLWLVLHELRDQHEAIAAVDLDELIARASAQEGTLERERQAVAIDALSVGGRNAIVAGG
jgi:hypothetical protein